MAKRLVSSTGRRMQRRTSQRGGGRVKKDKPVLRIFLSHKLGNSRDKAKRVAAALSVLANEQMEIMYSADFERGTEWEKEIRRGLEKAHWFILIYDGPTVSHEWCLFEAGYFRGHMDSDPKRKRLMCLHDPRHSLPNPLKGFAAVPARQNELHDLFEQIYLDEPWKIKPNLFAEPEQLEITEKIKRIVKEFGEEEVVAQFTISPTFTFHIKKEAKADLARGMISEDAQVSGDGPWEPMFGKPDSTIAWSWSELISGLQDWLPWAYQLAVMMHEGLTYKTVLHPSIALRIKQRNGTEGIYRVILRKVEKTVEEFRFTFAAAKIITPYQPNNHVNETRIYHLFNMAWFFRRQFLEKHAENLRDLAVIRDIPKERLEEEIRSINDDLKAMHAESQVRGVENPAVIINAFQGALREEVYTQLQEKWPKLAQNLQAACDERHPNVRAIGNAITEMDEINRFFLEVSLKELARRGPADLG